MMKGIQPPRSYTCPPAPAQRAEKSDGKVDTEQFDDEYNYGGAMS